MSTFWRAAGLSSLQYLQASHKLRRQAVSVVGNNVFIRNISNGGISDFVDVRKNEDGEPIPVGRSWKASELRLKSFEDLHKLWFVLLKERNMLHTEKNLAKRNGEIMKGFSRFKKVKISMARLKTVINERTREHKNKLEENVSE
jgi:large subunit ribosomal protein L47